MAAANSRSDEVSGPPTFSPEAHEMLRILGKNHLRDVTNDEQCTRAANAGFTADLTIERGLYPLYREPPVSGLNQLTELIRQCRFSWILRSYGAKGRRQPWPDADSCHSWSAFLF
jgi:hypothetical protein